MSDAFSYWFKFCDFYAILYHLISPVFCFLQFSIALHMPLTAKELQEGYVTELSEGPLSQVTSAHYLHKALVAKGVQITEAACKQWWQKYRKPPNAVTIPTAKDLQ